MPIIWWYRAAFPLRTRLIGDDDRRIKICLGPDCGKTSYTNPDLRFKQCKDCYELFGVYSYYCDAAWSDGALVRMRCELATQSGRLRPFNSESAAHESKR